MGPMRGIPYYNFPAFDDTAATLRALGHEPVNPAELDRSVGFDATLLPATADWTKIPDNFSFKDCRKRDIEAIESCDAYLKLPGCENSTGAKAEEAYARWMMLPEVRIITSPLSGEPTLLCSSPRATESPDEVRVTDPNTGGQKGSKRARFDLIPWDALWELAELYGAGALKYDDHNWLKGYKWSLSFAAMMRHAWKFWSRKEDIDPETKVNHLAAVAWHALALMTFYKRGLGTDDRWKDKHAAD